MHNSYDINKNNPNKNKNINNNNSRLRCVLDVSQTEVDFAETGTSRHSNLAASGRNVNKHSVDCGSPQPPRYQAAAGASIAAYASDVPGHRSSIKAHQSSMHLPQDSAMSAVVSSPSKMCLGDNYVQYRRVTDANKVIEPQEINVS